MVDSSIWQPSYTLTNTVVNALTRIEAARAVIERTALPPGTLAELSTQARIRATHHSTRIEGNALTLEEAAEAISERRRVFRGRERDVAEVRKQADFNLLLKDGAALNLGDTVIRVMATPGHTPACVAYIIDGAAFVGDTIFMPDSGTGRCDFPGGDAACLYHSIQKLLSLPDDTVLYLCHDYGACGAREVACQTTVAEQKANNIHVGGDISLKD